MPKNSLTPKKIKVGFDFDGVILYNPARIARPLVTFFKKKILKKKTTRFYVPKSKFARAIFQIFHWSSIFPANGIAQIKQMVKNGEIEAYLITARYDFLEPDLRHWIKKLDLEPYFKAVYLNSKNEQPHLYKERLINELGLDIFVEDNYDIVTHLNKKTKSKIFWVYNILDRWTYYLHKVPNLKVAVSKVQSHLR